MVGNVGNMYQNQNSMMYQQMQPGFYNQMTPGVNWQQEMLNRINTLQQQIQNSIPQQVQTQQQGFLKGRIAGSKEEVMSAQVDFSEPQFFPVGEDAIYVKKLGMDGKSQVLEYKLTNQSQNEKSNDDNNVNITTEFIDNFNTLKQNYEILTNKYNEVHNELLSIKNELGIEEVNKNES